MSLKRARKEVTPPQGDKDEEGISVNKSELYHYQRLKYAQEKSRKGKNNIKITYQK